MIRSRRLLVPVGLLLLWGCTQLKTTPTTPINTTQTPAPEESPAPFGSPSPTPTPTPEPTPTPPPVITRTTPTETSDFTAEAMDIAFSVAVAPGRKVKSVTVTYDQAELTTLTEAGPSFKLTGWNPQVVNNFAKTPDLTPVKAGDHKLVIIARDDQGLESKQELVFGKPLRITGWTEVASMPGPTSHMKMLADGASPPTFMSLWGSIDGLETNVVPRTDVYSFNPAGNGSWTTVNAAGSAIPRAAYGLGVHPNGLVAYLAGGRVGNQEVRTIDVFMPLRKVLEQSTAAMTNARRDPAVVYLNDYVYVIGGKGNGAPMYSVERVKIGTDGLPTGNFEGRADLTNARTGANAAVVGSEIWVFGGGSRPIEVYAPAANTWKFLTNAANQPVGTPEPWLYSLMVPAADRLFFFGGSKEDGQPVTRIYEFAPKTKTWRDVGPLPEVQGVEAIDRAETRLGGFFADGAFYLAGGISLPEGKVSAKVFKGATK